MTSDVGAQVAKWRSWIEKDIPSDVVGMHFKRMIWREVQEMVAANPEVGEVPSAFWDFYGENYAAAQAIAVRRQADRDARTCSLARLIKEMQADAELLTRDYYVGLLDERTDSDLLVKRANSDFDRLAGSGDHLDPRDSRS